MSTKMKRNREHFLFKILLEVKQRKIKVLRCPQLQKVSKEQKGIMVFSTFPLPDGPRGLCHGRPLSWAQLTTSSSLLARGGFVILCSAAENWKAGGGANNSILGESCKLDQTLHVEWLVKMFKLISKPLPIGWNSELILLDIFLTPVHQIGWNFHLVHVDKFIAFLVFQKFEYQWSLSIVSGWVGSVETRPGRRSEAGTL